jgi:predicted nucleotidyltransferase
MRRDRAIRILRDHADQLRREGVAHVMLFGSVAQDTATADSDVDLIVETTAEHPITLFTIGPLHDLFASLLGVPVDVIDKAGFERAQHLQHKAGELVHVF